MSAVGRLLPVGDRLRRVRLASLCGLGVSQARLTA